MHSSAESSHNAFIDCAVYAVSAIQRQARELHPGHSDTVAADVERYAQWVDIAAATGRTISTYQAELIDALTCELTLPLLELLDLTDSCVEADRNG
jgi:mRNA degradation ribonuclease J1/J2